MTTTPPASPEAPRPRLLARGGAFVASNAIVTDDVRLGRDCSVWYGVVIRGDCAPITIGELTNVQDNTVVHADTGVPNDIGAEVTIGHGAVVHGRRVGDGCLIGIKAVILGGAEIGEGCIVAAGAVVKEGAVIPARSLVAGVPAKVLRTVSDDEAATLRAHARHYLELARHHAR